MAITTVPMSLKALQVKHECYNAEGLETVFDFYEGGERFEKNKGKYLRPRGSDLQLEWKKARLACAYYSPHLSGKVDGLIGGILRNAPKITCAGDSAKDARLQYWHSLNSNADGNGVDLTAICRQGLLQEMLPARAYLCLCTPAIAAIEGESVEDAKIRKRLDVRIKALEAKEIDDWAEDGSWYRAYCCTKELANGFGPPIKEIHTWRYYEAKNVISYVAERAIKDGIPENWPEDKVINPDVQPHGLGTNPIIPIEVPSGFNLGGRLLPIAKALFNREASLSYHLDNAGYAVPMLKTDKPVGQVYLNELNALNVGLQGDAKILEPGGTTADSLTTDCLKLKKDLDSAMQSLADEAKDRISGVAQQQFREPKEVLMSLFAMPVIDALEKAVTAIKEYRGEDSLEIEISGMEIGGFDIQSAEVVIASMTQLLNLPEMPATARQIAYGYVIQAALPVRKDEDIVAIQNELKEIKGPSPALQEATNTNPDGSPRNAKTNAPQGMGADQIRQGNVAR